MNSNQHAKILFEYEDSEGDYSIESAWALQIDGNYQLDNILFYASEYSLGDIVSAEEREGELYVKELIQESGHSTIRILFTREDYVADTRSELEALGCSSEISNLPFLVAVDIPPKISYSRIKQFLENGVEKEKWGYEEACIAHND